LRPDGGQIVGAPNNHYGNGHKKRGFKWKFAQQLVINQLQVRPKEREQ
jgi:hypothetical protein